MASVKLLLNKSRALRDGSYPLVFQLIYQRKKKLIYTSYKLYPEEFDTDKEKVCYISGARFSLRKVRAMNNMIALQRSEIERCIKKFECCKREYSVQDIVARYRAMHDDYNLLHYIDRCIERKRAMKRFGTAAAYQSTRNSLALFTKEKGVCFSGIDNIFQRDYTEFLLKRGVSNNTVCFYIRNLKSLCNQAVKEGYRLAEKSPFENVWFGSLQEVRTVSLAAHFTDEGPGGLSYAYEYDPAYLTLTSGQGEFRLKPLKFGLSQVKITATDAEGLAGETDFLVMTHDYRQEVTFYPNPVMDKLNVRMGREVEGTIYLTFSTLDGQLVKKVNAPIGPFAPAEVDLSGLKKGTYVVQLKYLQETYTRTLIKQ